MVSVLKQREVAILHTGCSGTGAPTIGLRDLANLEQLVVQQVLIIVAASAMTQSQLAALTPTSVTSVLYRFFMRHGTVPSTRVAETCHLSLVSICRRELDRGRRTSCPKQCACCCSYTLGQEVGLIEFEEHVSIDPKPAALLCLRQNVQSKHHFMTLDGMLSGKEGCLWHKESSCSENIGSPHAFIAGFPCAPYSTQRDTRHVDGRLANWVSSRIRSL